MQENIGEYLENTEIIRYNIVKNLKEATKMQKITEEIRERLFSLRDEKYARFSSSLIPNISPESVIGVRAPQLRAMARELSTDVRICDFLADLPHEYHEENCLHAYLIGEYRDIDTVLSLLDSFLPYVTNWAVCDTMRPRVLSKHKERLLTKAYQWLNSEHDYTVRYAIGMLMLHFLGDGFDESYPELVAKIESDEYYVNMMRAWYFAEGLAKQYDRILPYIEGRRLDMWTHRKTIQKAVESFKIPDERKELLKSFR